MSDETETTDADADGATYAERVHRQFVNADHLDPDSALIQAMRRESHKTPLHALLDLTPIKMDGQDEVVFRMPTTGGALNSSGNIHGGAMATLIDMTAGTTVALGNPRFKPGENTLVTADMHIRYLGRARGDWVEATGKILRVGRQLTIVEVTVRDDDGRLIATADFGAMLVPHRQPMRDGDATAPDL
ncbi:MAG TPA: PaaI family thioesterase [Nitriliruptorales bacterium]